MSTIYTSLISASELSQLQAENPLILDCRHQLKDSDWGAEQFQRGHITNAQHADMDKHLAANPGKGGRHPLPGVAEWVAQLRSWGLAHNQQVVVYDDAGGAFAARAWWMLRWVGHEQVAVLDGGLGQWPDELETGTAQNRPEGNFTSKPPLVEVRSVAQVSASLDATATGSLLDARSQARYQGLEEPIDPVAGHIPTARCRPFQLNLKEDGLFLSASTLSQQFAAYNDPVVCYCGSGVTACHNILALHIAGRRAALFVDSWSGWITDKSRPVASSIQPDEEPQK